MTPSALTRSKWPTSPNDHGIVPWSPADEPYISDNELERFLAERRDGKDVGETEPAARVALHLIPNGQGGLPDLSDRPRVDGARGYEDTLRRRRT